MSQLIYISNRRKEVLAPPPFGDTKSLDFDGSTERLANTTAQAIGIADDWSIFLWLKPHTLDSFEIPLRIMSGNNNMIDIRHFTTPKLQIFTRNSTGGGLKQYDWNNVLSTNTWFHLVLTWNGTTGDVLKLYIDSTDTAPDAKLIDNAGTMTDSNRPIEFGIGGSYFDGEIHSGGMWNTVLSQNEVTTIWNNGDGSSFDLGADSGNYVSSANIVHWWQLGQPAGGDYPVGTTYVRDRVSSGGIDISANDANMSDADIVDTYPGE